jgi:hypothetical protein
LPEGTLIYRARRAESRVEAKEYLKTAESNLGPPSAEKATAGRMNAAGIRVFYGAFSPETCIAEVRPHVGGLIVVGAFNLLRDIKVLDMTLFSSAGNPCSIFDDRFEGLARKLRFLESFHVRVSRPIQPHEEVVEYLPTQAVAEYVHHRLHLDGIIFASAQLEGVVDDDDEGDRSLGYDRNDCNVTLFDNVCIVAPPAENSDASSVAVPPSLRLEPDKTQVHRVTRIAVQTETVRGIDDAPPPHVLDPAADILI